MLISANRFLSTLAQRWGERPGQWAQAATNGLSDDDRAAFRDICDEEGEVYEHEESYVLEVCRARAGLPTR